MEPTSSEGLTVSARLNDALSSVVNVSLIGLLLASWAAYRYPAASTYITISAVVGSVFVFCGVMIARSVSARDVVEVGQTDQADRVSADGQLNVVGDAIFVREGPDRTDESWQVLMEKLEKLRHGETDSAALDRIIYANIFGKREFHASTINIGTLNLVYSDNNFTIKSASVERKSENASERKSDKKDKKIDMVLVADEGPRIGQF